MTGCNDISTVDDVLRLTGDSVLTVAPGQTVATAAHVIDQNKKGLAIVSDGGRRVLGVVSVIDVNRAVADHGVRAPCLPVSEIMNAAVVSCAPQDRVQDALEKMKIYHIRHLPVVEDGILQGLVTMRDLLRCGSDAPGSPDQEAVERFRDFVPSTDYH